MNKGMIMFFLLLFSLFANAESTWTTKEMFPNGWILKEHCEKFGKSKCFEIEESSERYKKVGNNIVLDNIKEADYLQKKAEKEQKEQDKILKRNKVKDALRALLKKEDNTLTDKDLEDI